MKNIRNQKILQFGTIAVYVNMAGILLSGLVFPILSLIFRPQPTWQGAELFIKSFSSLQTMTFFFGYFLVIGSLLTFVSLYLLSGKKVRVWSLSALAINIVFTAVVFLNYIIQTTYVPYLAMNNPPETASVLASFSMANPGSFAWALEMYGWGGIGLSFIFMSFIFRKERYGKLLKILFLLNGICSVISALVTSIDMNWLFTPAGLTALVIWNLLVFIIDIFLLRFFSELRTK